MPLTLMLTPLILAACVAVQPTLAVSGAAPVVVAAAALPDAGGASAVDAGAPVTPAKVVVTGSVADAGVAVGSPTQTSTPKTDAAPMSNEVKALVDRVQAFYEKTTDFSADFRQEYTYKAFKRTQTSSGTVIYKKPATMRWEYQKPTPRTFVLAGDKVYALDPEALTLTKASIATNQLSASVTFLWGQGKLDKEFAITQKPCPKCSGTLLELDPLKPDPRFQKVRLEVDPKTAQVLKSTVIDPDGSENAITFSALKTNVGIDEKAFKIVPPAGTQVIDLTQAQGQKPAAPSKP